MKVLLPRWRPPGRPLLLARRSRLPLGLTLLTTVGLLLVPSILLARLPRPQAIGLEKLMGQVSLLQSFRPNPDRSVPEVWRQRFGGPQAEQLWRFQTRTWWQFWDGHADGQPFLALSSRGLPPSVLRTVPVPPLKVGDLLIFPPDLLSRQILSDRLLPQVRRSSGLRQRCLPRLEHDQAVFWRPAAIGVLVGPLAPFLQNVQEGCLSLTIAESRLLWHGEAASVEGMVLQLPDAGSPSSSPAVMSSDTDALLEVQGVSLERLLAGLLARELIRQPLAERYGLGPEQLRLLRQTPFRLQLRPRAQGPFQASIELAVLVGPRGDQWQELLRRLGKGLEKEGLRSLPRPSDPEVLPLTSQRPITGGAARRGFAPKSLWRRKDGVVVGGWQWLTRNGTQDQISLFLGPEPAVPLRFVASGLPQGQGMVLMARPEQLERLGLLPPDLPEVVRQSSWLWISSQPFRGLGSDAPVSQLQGSLVLRP